MGEDRWIDWYIDIIMDRLSDRYRGNQTGDQQGQLDIHFRFIILISRINFRGLERKTKEIGRGGE